jgi:hypothetical protein
MFARLSLSVERRGNGLPDTPTISKLDATLKSASRIQIRRATWAALKTGQHS